MNICHCNNNVRSLRTSLQGNIHVRRYRMYTHKYCIYSTYVNMYIHVSIYVRMYVHTYYNINGCKYVRTYNTYIYHNM